MLVKGSPGCRSQGPEFGDTVDLHNAKNIYTTSKTKKVGVWNQACLLIRVLASLDTWWRHSVILEASNTNLG